MYLVEGDANTRFFHLQACHRSRKNHIASLKVHDSEIVLNEEIANAVFEHYNAIMGTPFQRTADIDLDALGLQLHDLTMLDVCFFEFEIWATIAELPSDKALGPDGFTGLFYKLAWPIIKADVINAFNAFWALDGRSFNLINEAFMVLLKKKSEPVEIKDYRPISLSCGRRRARHADHASGTSRKGKEQSAPRIGGSGLRLEGKEPCMLIRRVARRQALIRLVARRKREPVITLDSGSLAPIMSSRVAYLYL
jgi:hypothetical protein